jgi:hypothetical protein
MSRQAIARIHRIVRIAVGIVIGLGLASVPFLQYGARTHPHSPHHAQAHQR